MKTSAFPSLLLRSLRLLLSIAPLPFAVACATPEADVVLNFENTALNTGANLRTDLRAIATQSAPTVFGIKLIAAYLTEDIDSTTQNNVGKTAMVYLNSTCADDIMHCDISGGTAEDGQPMDKVVTDFFDLSSPSSVNEQLNAQGRGVEEGTYKYVRLEFCKYNSEDATNIQWGTDSVATRAFQRDMCTVNSAEMTTPLEIAAGDTVTLTLSYDLSAAVSTGSDAYGDDCTGSGSTKTCFQLPTFTPSASKN